MQECCGVVPLAQVREPYTAARLLGEQLPLERMYGIHTMMPGRQAQPVSKADRAIGAPTGGGDDEVLSPLWLCEALATKRGRFLARTGRPDAHAAGREILYDAQDGVLPVWWLPPKE